MVVEEEALEEASVVEVAAAKLVVEELGWGEAALLRVRWEPSATPLMDELDGVRALERSVLDRWDNPRCASGGGRRVGSGGGRSSASSIGESAAMIALWAVA